LSADAFNPMKFAVLYYFGELSYWKLPDIAAEALNVGFDGVALRKLAGLTNVVENDLIPADIDSAFREMGVDAPISKDAARLALAVESARKAVSGESNVLDEATRIRIYLCELGDPAPELHRIVNLSRDAKNAPRIRWKTIEEELKIAMSQFLSTQG
jgi:hypothetical protein